MDAQTQEIIFVALICISPFILIAVTGIIYNILTLHHQDKEHAIKQATKKQMYDEIQKRRDKILDDEIAKLNQEVAKFEKK